MLSVSPFVKRRLVILARLAASAGVSLMVLGLMLRLFTGGAEDAERPRVLAVLRATWMPAVGAYASLALLQALFRAVRYRILIAAGAPGQPPSLAHTYLVTAVRNMLVDLLPARLGELSYAGMMNVGCSVPASACLSSLGVSFVFDFIALLGIVAAVLAYQLFTSGLQGWLVTAAAFLLALGVVLTGLLFFGISLMTRLLERLLRRWRASTSVVKGIAFLDGVAEAIAGARRSRVLAQVAALSLAVRLTKYAALYVLFKAVVVPSFMSVSHATFPEILTALLCAEGLSSLPVPSFMSFGTYEAGGTLALTRLGFGAAESVVAMIAIHIWSQIVDYSLGGMGGVLFLFRRRAVAAVAAAEVGCPAPRHAAWGLAALAVVVAGVVLFGLQWQKTRRAGALTPPGAGEAVTVAADELTHRADVLGGVRGFVVWSSNRFGNHDLLRMDLPDLRLSRLTSHPNVETFPRISPDGRSVAFARSREPWVSQRNPLPWSVHVLDLASGRERLVSQSGNTPTWSEDGATIYFQRNGGEVVAHELSTGAETVPFSAGKKGAIPASVLLQTPSFSQTRAAMAVTCRGAWRGTLVVPVDGSPRKVGGGCQLAWAPDSSFLTFVDDGGRMKNAIYRVDAMSLERTLWLDLPGPYSHEYFPKVSNDVRWLVLGACATGHEHDTADYEIFLWKIGSAPEAAVRLTHHTGNDCWPDVFIER